MGGDCSRDSTARSLPRLETTAQPLLRFRQIEKRRYPMPHAAPSISVILLCYDSELFVRDAIESALAQDYCGSLEILISDDASRDGTFEIVRKVVSEYAGPHTVRVLRRQENSGSKSAHLNHVFPEALGEILISFDDDDVSRPGRVRKIVAEFANEDVQAVYSSFSLIDENGSPRGTGKVPHPAPNEDASQWFARVDAFAAGTTLAVRRRVIETFGPLDADVHEDIALPFRASLLGAVVFIPEDLVMVRRRAESLTSDLERFRSIADYRKRMLAGIEQARRNLESRRSDLDIALDLQPERSAELKRLRSIAEDTCVVAESTAKLLSPSFFERVAALLHLIRLGAYRDELAQHAFIALLPRTYLRYKRRSLGTATSDLVGN
jgi:glycosyltransferase involved in cell wall biosynthesis